MTNEVVQMVGGLLKINLADNENVVFFSFSAKIMGKEKPHLAVIERFKRYGEHRS